MSATRDHGDMVFECDKCGEVYEAAESDFHVAWDEAKREGWRAFKNEESDEWCHSCPDCVNTRNLFVKR